ncbi:MAG TPA: hypothetical protein PLE22_09905 [Acidovorax sp.]|jgi:hypothetical protein|nr:hypothetical protein [Acidovorax sp.]
MLVKTPLAGGCDPSKLRRLPDVTGIIGLGRFRENTKPQADQNPRPVSSPDAASLLRFLLRFLMRRSTHITTSTLTTPWPTN